MDSIQFLTTPEYSKKYGLTRARIYQQRERLVCKYDRRGMIVADIPANIMYFKTVPQRLELINLVKEKYNGGASIGEISKDVELSAEIVTAIIDGLIN